jgi:hypothetical protein
MKKIIALFVLFSSISLLNAQNSMLTFFSEEGELFYVILDGIRQNNLAAANVKVIDLDRQNYRAKIVFDNGDLKDINKNLFVQDADGKALHTVYRIVKNKKGEMDMKLSSMNEATEMQGSKKESIIKYHDKEEPKESQTTTTTTTTKSADETVNVNMPGTKVQVKQTDESVNINLDLSGMKDLMSVDGMNNTESTTITTTTTTTTKNTTKPKVESPKASEPEAIPASSKGCALPMSSSDFENGKSSITKQSFAESQIKTAKQMTKVNCLTVKQIRSIMDIFSFEEYKLEYAKYAYEYCTEKKNYYQLTEAFTFSSSSDSLNEFLEGQH